MQPKILLVDDDKDLLEVYREILAQLPSHPEIFTSNTGARALAMLENEPFTIMVCDLNMPKMDGLQVLSIVRRKYPELRTVVLTSLLDEQFRSRAYGLGVDLYWQKPTSTEETKQFLECLESLVGRENGASGFRGVQSKSLVDLIQLECLSHNSTVLKIINGPLTGRIWIQAGEVIDAATEELTAEPAFHRILSWKAGNFEALPLEPGRARTILNSYQGLLLETAQAQDEALSQGAKANNDSPLTTLSRMAGVSYALVLKPAGSDPKFEARGLESPQPVVDWSRKTLEQFRALGERLQAGPLQHFDGLGPQGHVGLASIRDLDICVGWEPALSTTELRESMKKALALWVS
ncbi:MAG TPA: response regulator [Verrucomicrobiae bacterium]|jgi:CheY-like chemotaxis protein|nr:response regulator [Verrucomicrobiae bacterium]